MCRSQFFHRVHSSMELRLSGLVEAHLPIEPSHILSIHIFEKNIMKKYAWGICCVDVTASFLVFLFSSFVPMMIFSFYCSLG